RNPDGRLGLFEFKLACQNPWTIGLFGGGSYKEDMGRSSVLPTSRGAAPFAILWGFLVRCIRRGRGELSVEELQYEQRDLVTGVQSEILANPPDYLPNHRPSSSALPPQTPRRSSIDKALPSEIRVSQASPGTTRPEPPVWHAVSPLPLRIPPSEHRAKPEPIPRPVRPLWAGKRATLLYSTLHSPWSLTQVAPLQRPQKAAPARTRVLTRSRRNPYWFLSRLRKERERERQRGRQPQPTPILLGT
ncbi:hypothetical protein CKAH01_02428, partial [Colletotrichum kahawae]